MRRPALSFLAAAMVLGPLCARSETKPTPQLAPPNAPKSEFSFRPGFTRDPFFPKSQDVPPPHTVAATNVTQVAKPQSGVPDSIILKGISHTSLRKLAIINNRTVGEGEDFTAYDGGKSVVVRCVEIKEQSVIVSANGATKELALRVK